MKLFAPKYYVKFKCIADKCTHSCCTGWEIDIDARSLQKYRELPDGYGDNIRQSISENEVPHFKLGDDERCPHLDENGLCRIITELGEGYLCDICREHPRFYNTTALGREVGLGMSCEEACRIILASDDFDQMTELGAVRGRAPKITFDVTPHRDFVFKALKNAQLSLCEKLNVIEKEYELDLAQNEESLKGVLEELEYLNEADKELFSCYSSNPQVAKEDEKPLCSALAYFVYRHCSSARGLAEFRAALGLCLFLEGLIASVLARTERSIFDIARTISEEIEYSEDNTCLIKEEFLF